ncbi:putative Auxin-binding protein [Candidatus Paraburkholderia calva]|nr:putative Auxin-binding protein [Candidatus Paraburkholderia calva]
MKAPIVNLDALDSQPFPEEIAPTGEAAERYAPRISQIAPRLGARKLRYSLIVLAPGKRAFPFHHRVNEEMFFVVESEREVRIGGASHAIRAGDVIACPPGGADIAHQIVDTSAQDLLRYLAVSTQQLPEVVEYPDTGRHAVLVADEPAQTVSTKGFRAAFRVGNSLDYWEGE